MKGKEVHSCWKAALLVLYVLALPSRFVIFAVRFFLDCSSPPAAGKGARLIVASGRRERNRVFVLFYCRNKTRWRETKIRIISILFHSLVDLTWASVLTNLGKYEKAHGVANKVS
ncbi:hypothetical protein GUJ93_ZPchr0001g31464 [Zizania palustris]|uniref:Uncharacterized protein n=1 Tax=Zizania palustris TaxID=103762 RepID=A0A8J5RPE4_ZIZPA|nr:hypothetical protein GUJ93_ZPchr0001g31464 [Zizania palustris]